MKTVRIIVIILFTGINVIAQNFDVDTLLYNGNLDKHINFVILGDGYTGSELSKFVVDAANFTSAFFNEIPYSNYKNYFNVFIIKVPSNESGASHPGTATDEDEPVFPVINVDNYFGSTFDSYGIHRLLVATKTLVISNVLASNFPKYDQVLILVSSPYYGGSGGYYPVASTYTGSAQIAIHEFGHSFAGLADEYWAGDNYAREAYNMTQQIDPILVKWKNWIGINSIGIYPHCCGAIAGRWYKPHLNCKMQYLLDTHFCSVCTEATIEKIHFLVTPIEFYYPIESKLSPTVYPLKFKLNLITPVPNTLKINWLLAGTSLKQNIDSVLINENNLLTGNNTLQASIEDTSQLLRVDNHNTIHISLITWTIDKTITGINEITNSSSELIIDLFPNPTSEFINLKIQGVTKGAIKFELYDLQGKRIKASRLYNDIVNTINLNNLAQGVYSAKIFIDDNLIISKKIIRN